MPYLNTPVGPNMEFKIPSDDPSKKQTRNSDGSTKPTLDAGATDVKLDTNISKGANVECSFTGEQPQLFIQVMACLVASLTQLSTACSFTFSGVTLPQLTSENSTDLTLDGSSTALFGSLPNMGAILGSLLSGILMVSVGQRATMLISLPLSLLCWLGIAFANSVPFLLAARFFLGVSAGLLEVVPYSYVAEISYEKYRGTLSGTITVMLGLGILFCYGIGAFDLTWRHLALVIAAVTCAPPFIGLLFFHESPRWLASKGNFEKASKALQFFRGRQYNTRKEFADIVHNVRESSASKNNVLSQFKHLADPSISKRFAILCFMGVLWQWGGNNALLSYTATIFSETGSCSSPYVCSLLVGVGRTIGSIAFLVTSDYVGRRPGFVISSLGCSLCMFALGTYFYIKIILGYEEELLAEFFWIPLVSVLCYAIFISSVAAIHSLLPCEILPVSFRLMGKGLVSIFSYSLSFSVIQLFPPLTNLLDLYGVFWLYGTCAALASLVPLFLLPETKGKSLEDIENIYKGPKVENTRL